MSTVLDALGEVIADDITWLADDAPLPATGTVGVSLARWHAEAPALAARRDAVAVKLPNNFDVLTLDATVLTRPLLALDFPAFADGRAYSQAQRLRSRCGYTGALRATGAAVVSDQLAMMKRSGITEFVLRADQSFAICQKALLGEARPMPYQPTLDQRSTVFAQRR